MKTNNAPFVVVPEVLNCLYDGQHQAVGHLLHLFDAGMFRINVGEQEYELIKAAFDQLKSFHADISAEEIRGVTVGVDLAARSDSTAVVEVHCRGEVEYSKGLEMLEAGMFDANECDMANHTLRFMERIEADSAMRNECFCRPIFLAYQSYIQCGRITAADASGVPIDLITEAVPQSHGYVLSIKRRPHATIVEQGKGCFVAKYINADGTEGGGGVSGSFPWLYAKACEWLRLVGVDTPDVKTSFLSAKELS